MIGPLMMEAFSSSISAFLFTAVALAAGTFAVYFYIPTWRVRKVPGPPALPLVGHLPLLAKHGVDLFRMLAKEYGPVYRFHMGRQPLVIVADAELCKEVGIKKFKSVPNRSVPAPIRGSPIHNKGLFFTRDSRWQSMRNVVTSVHQPSYVAGLIPDIQSYIERASRLLHDGEEIVFNDFALKLFSDTIGHVGFGVDFGLTKNATADASPTVPPQHHPGAVAVDADMATGFIRKHFHATTALKMDLSAPLSFVVGAFMPFLQEPVRQLMLRVPGTADRRLEETNTAMTSLLDRIVAERAGDSKEEKNFLSVLLNASRSTEAMKKLLTPDYLSALTYENLLAGSTTQSFTLSCLVYLVAMYPEVEEKLLREIDAFGPKDVVPTAENLQSKFPYLEQVLKETMRFYMASPVIAREASEDIEVGGYFLPKGTWVWLALGVLAKDPKDFPDPDVFRPERFDPESEECKRRHPYAFIPFGIGPRICIGQKYAMQQLKLVVIHLYRRYVFRHSPTMEFPLQLQYSIILNFKYGVKVQVIERKN